MSRPPGSRSLWPGRRWARVIRSSAERRHSSPATVRRRAWRRYASCLSCRPPFPIARWNAAELSHGHDLLDAARERFSQSEGAQGALAVAARTPRLDGARHRIRRDETSECDEGTERDEVRAEYRTELATRLGDDRERHDLDVRALRGAGAVVEQRQSARSQIREVARARLRRERDEDFGTCRDRVGDRTIRDDDIRLGCPAPRLRAICLRVRRVHSRAHGPIREEQRREGDTLST